MVTTTHNLDVGQTELELALDQRHEIRLPAWELIELDGLGDDPPPPPPLEWGGLELMAAGFDVGGGEEPEDEDWELEALHDPEPDEPDEEYEHIEWVTGPDDWELEQLEAVGESPAEPEPLGWSGGSGIMAAGFDVGGSGGPDLAAASEDDEDWELEQLAGEFDELSDSEPEDDL